MIPSTEDAATAIGLSFHREIINVSDSLKDTQSDVYWIENHLEKFNEFEFDYPSAYLKAIGFDYSARQCCMNLINHPIFGSTQTWRYWCLFFVQTILNYKFQQLPNGVSSEPSILGNKVSKKFKQPIKAICNSKKDSQENENYPQNTLERLLRSLCDGNWEDSNYIFFHGTNYHKANTIVRIGIDRRRGAAEQDFSHCNGFYLHTSGNLELAYEWARRNSSPAIVVFLIPKEVYDPLKVNVPEDLRAKYIKLYRRAKDILGDETGSAAELYDDYMELEDKVEGLASEYRILEGKACGNPRKVKQNNADPINLSWTQVSLRSDKAENIFHSGAVGVIYLS